MRGSPQFVQYFLAEVLLKPQCEHGTEPRWPDRRTRFIPIISSESSRMLASASSSGGFCRAVVTAVAFVVTFEIWVTRFVWVCVTEPLLVEKIVVVSVVPAAVTAVVVTLTVDVAAVATAVVLVTLVLIVEVLTTVV